MARLTGSLSGSMGYQHGVGIARLGAARSRVAGAAGQPAPRKQAKARWTVCAVPDGLGAPGISPDFSGPAA